MQEVSETGDDSIFTLGKAYTSSNYWLFEQTELTLAAAAMIFINLRL